MIIRSPKNDRERLIAGINSTDEDLYPDGNGRIIVTGKNAEGEILYLGDIDESILYLKSSPLRQLIEHIRFSSCRVKGKNK